MTYNSGSAANPGGSNVEFFPQLDASDAMPLAEQQFHKEQGKGLEHQHYEIGNEKRTAAMFETKIRKPPNITYIRILSRLFY